MKNCSVFASLISPSKMILFEKKYQTFDTVFHHQMKHLEVRQKYSAAHRIFNSLLGVSSGVLKVSFSGDFCISESFLFCFFLLMGFGVSDLSFFLFVRVFRSRFVQSSWVQLIGLS